MPSQLPHLPHTPNKSPHHSKAAAPTTAAAPTNELQAPKLIFPAAPVEPGAGAVLAADAADAVVEPDSAAPVPLALGGPV